MNYKIPRDKLLHMEAYERTDRSAINEFLNALIRRLPVDELKDHLTSLELDGGFPSFPLNVVRRKLRQIRNGYTSEPATGQDVQKRMEEQDSRYVRHLREGLLTKEWSEYGSKHQDRIGLLLYESR